MTSRRRKIIAFFTLFLGILALILATFGLYIRLSGAGNPVGSLYILLGSALATGGAIVALLVFPQRANRTIVILLFITLAIEIFAIAAVVSYLRG